MAYPTQTEPPRDCRRLHSNLPSHVPLFVWPRVTHGAGRGRLRGALPGCASPVLAIGGAHLLSAPRSRTGPVGAAQSDRVPEMPSRRLVASTLIRPIVKHLVRTLLRRHLHPYTCRFPSRSEPARCRLLHDLAHATSRSEPLPPLAWAGLPAPVVIVPLIRVVRGVRQGPQLAWRSPLLRGPRPCYPAPGAASRVVPLPRTCLKAL
jgi:hypothetical protein